MVISTFGQYWAQRLAQLKRAVAERPEGPTWFWAMRIGILEFLISRYDNPSAARTLTRSGQLSPVDSANACDREPEAGNPIGIGGDGGAQFGLRHRAHAVKVAPALATLAALTGFRG